MVRYIIESALDDRDDSDVYDRTFAELDSITPGSRMAYDIYRDKLMAEGRLEDVYECRIDICVSHKDAINVWDKGAYIDLAAEYDIIYNAFDRSSSLFENTDIDSGYNFVIDVPRVREPNYPDFNPIFEFPLPDRYSVFDNYYSRSITSHGQFFLQIIYPVYVNKFEYVDYENFHHVYQQFMSMLIRLAARFRKLGYDAHANMLKRYPSGKFVDFGNSVRMYGSIRNREFAVTYNMFCDDETCYEHNGRVSYETSDDSDMNNHSVMERIVRGCLPTFGMKVVRTGFPTAEEKYGLKLDLQCKYIDPRPILSNNKLSYALLILNATPMYGTGKEYRMPSMAECIFENVILNVDPRILYGKRFFVIVNGDIRYTDNVSTNENRRQMNRVGMRARISNKTYNGKYLWRVQEISITGLAYSSYPLTAYVVLTDRRGTLGLKKYDETYDNTNAFDIVMDRLNCHDLAHMTQSQADAEYKSVLAELDKNSK